MIAVRRVDVPEIAFVIEAHASDRIGKANVFAQSKPVSHMIGVAFEIGLSRKIFRPSPFLLQILVKAIGIFDALNIHARAGIAVPVPRAADTIARFEAGDTVIPPQTINRVHPGKTGADNNDIDDFGRCLVFHCRAALFLLLHEHDATEVRYNP